MRAITISRQMGSQGDELAEQVAERLGWRRVCRDVINRAALAAGAPQVALAEIDELGFFGLHPLARQWQAYTEQIERIVRDLADEGNVVLVGRGGQMILQDRSDVLHARVVAPLSTRIAHLQQARKSSPEAVRARLAKSDKSRTRLLWRSYGVRLDEPSLYHLVVNTGLLSLSQAVELIIHASQQRVAE